MEINFLEFGGDKIAEISTAVVIKDAQQAAELLMNCHYSGTDKLIVYEQSLTPDFFDLKTRLAGDILQKFSTYDGRLAIVGDFSKYTSQSLRDFIYERNKMGRISFVRTKEEAVKVLRRS